MWALLGHQSLTSAMEVVTSATDDVTVEEFKSWACTRAFDIISEGRYKKYLVRCRERGDAWVVPVNDAINKIQLKVRTVVTAIDAIDNHPFNILANVCRDVISNTTPPVRIREGPGVCLLTGVRANNCLDLERGSRGSSSRISVGRALANHSPSTTAVGKKDSSTPLLPTNLPLGCTGGEDRQVARPPKRRKCASIAKSNVQASGDTLCSDQTPTPALKAGSVSAQSCTEGVQGSSMGDVQDTGMPVHNRPNHRCGCPSDKVGGDSEILVLPKFALFFTLLWYVVKIEHVVRNHTRCWIDSVNSEDGSTPSTAQTDNVQKLCDMFAAQDDFFKSLALVFNRGIRHVITSLSEHERSGFAFESNETE